MSHEKPGGSGLVFAGFLVAIGLALAGYFVSDGLARLKAADRFVTVKGLSEREVEADLANWSISFTQTADVFGNLLDPLEANTLALKGFLVDQGFREKELNVLPPSIIDKLADRYANANTQQGVRYIATQTFLIRTSDISRVRAARKKIDELLEKGIAIEESANYYFTRLNDIKPEMIAEATRKAREAAEQFAKDSGSQVGAIRNARQGYFTIKPVEGGSPYKKEVRVVTTVEYFITD